MITKPRLFLLVALFASALLALPAFAQNAARDPHLVRAMELRSQALSAYGSGSYDEAADLARQAKAELALIKATKPAAKPAAKAAVKTPTPAPASEILPLPATYTVRLLPSDRDCFSKIAGFPFIYGDRSKWALLFTANKGSLKHPENEDLILPAEVLVIPSIAGELRSGAYDPLKQYPVFKAE